MDRWICFISRKIQGLDVSVIYKMSIPHMQVIVLEKFLVISNVLFSVGYIIFIIFPMWVVRLQKV